MHFEGFGQFVDESLFQDVDFVIMFIHVAASIGSDNLGV
jgi:hypothetical protein